MAKYPTLSIKFDRRKTANSTSPGTVEIAVAFQQRMFYMSTGVRVYQSQWNSQKSVVKSCEKAVEYNNTIRNIVNTVSMKIDELWKNNSFSIDNLRKALRQCDGNHDSPISWIREQIALRNIRNSTKKHHFIMADALERCGLFREWSDFTYANIKKFDDFVRSRGIMQSSIHNYHKRLKPYISEAVRHGLIDKNPYDVFVSDRGDSKSVEYLTEEEWKRIENLPLREKYDKVRDCFVFCCYTGLSYSDMVALKKSDIFEHDGVRYIRSSRKKTGNKFVTILPDNAEKILEKYNYKLPAYANSTLNKSLKDIAMLANISKNVTLHVARHTFATWSLHTGVPLAIVSKTLGHSSIQTTEIYAKVIEDDVMKAISKLK